MNVRDFIEHHYRHFNAAALKDAAHGYAAHMDAGGRMLVTLAGAMSTAELGLSLAEMIRAGKVSAICCTGANLEEDVFNLVAHDHYERIPNYRDLTPEQEKELKPYRKTHVLLSFSPGLFPRLQKHLEKILAIEGVEYEQGSN